MSARRSRSLNHPLCLLLIHCVWNRLLFKSRLFRPFYRSFMNDKIPTSPYWRAQRVPTPDLGPSFSQVRFLRRASFRNSVRCEFLVVPSLVCSTYLNFQWLTVTRRRLFLFLGWIHKSCLVTVINCETCHCRVSSILLLL